MKRLFASLLCATIISLGITPAAHAEDEAAPPSAMDAAMEKYIMDHPDVIIRSLRKFNNRDKISAAEQDKIKNSSNESPIIGNKNGDVTLVEFFDYHCGYCKRFYPTLAQLVAEDKNLRVVFKELPIIAPDSEIATRASLAVYDIDPAKYFGFHTALMKMNSKFDNEKMMDLARQAGVDESQFSAAMKSEKISKEIDDTKQLAEDIGISGTPAILIGKTIMPGAVDIDTLRSKIAYAREMAKAGKS